MSAIIMGMNRGETPRWPRLTYRPCWSSKVSMPPMPEAMMQPARYESASLNSPRPLAAMASMAAATAIWL